MAVQPDLKIYEYDNGGGGGTCFLSGTRIASPEGAMCVENLTVGAMVLTLDGASRPVRWLGHRGVDCSRYRDPSEVWPYRIEAGAFDDGKPERDLWLSRGHTLCVENALIQVDHLVNGATIVQVPRDLVEYWHVELDSHDVLLAEGLPAESYRDDGNRPQFENGGAFIEAYPDFLPKLDSDTCLPVVKSGPLLERTKARLLARAELLGYRLSDDPDLHVMADGKRIVPVRSGARFEFQLPEATVLELRSRSFVPAQINPTNGDARALGVAVTKLELDAIPVPLASDSGFKGWHRLEQDASLQWRWSNGTAQLPAGTRNVVIELCHEGSYYWDRTAAAVVTRLAAAG